MVQGPSESYIPGEDIGHVSRDVALILSDFMDSPNPQLNENNVYGRGFRFACRLRDDTNHSCEGYAIDVVVFSINSNSWTDLLLDILSEQNVVCHKIN